MTLIPAPPVVVMTFRSMYARPPMLYILIGRSLEFVMRFPEMYKSTSRSGDFPTDQTTTPNTGVVMVACRSMSGDRKETAARRGKQQVWCSGSEREDVHIQICQAVIEKAPMASAVRAAKDAVSGSSGVDDLGIGRIHRQRRNRCASVDKNL